MKKGTKRKRNNESKSKSTSSKEPTELEEANDDAVEQPSKEESNLAEATEGSNPVREEAKEGILSKEESNLAEVAEGSNAVREETKEGILSKEESNLAEATDGSNPLREETKEGILSKEESNLAEATDGSNPLREETKEGILSKEESNLAEVAEGSNAVREETKEGILSKEESNLPEATDGNNPVREETGNGSRKSRGRAKRAKVSKPEAEQEYFPEKRNLEDLWQQAFPVGTEWDLLDKVYQYKWDFSNLEKEFEEGGELHNKRVYLFGCSEPQFVSFKDESKITYVPAIVVVIAPFPPSDKIGIKSVQMVDEEIVPMKHMKMEWIPYVPLEDRAYMVERLKSQIFILSCVQRRSSLKHLKEERIKKYEYCLPYLYNPFKEDEVEQSTIVDIMFPAEPKPVFCEFDWELDELEEFTNNIVEAEELAEDQKDPFKEFVKEKVREAKKANREARDARKKALEEMSEDKKTAFQNMRFLKFYPVTTSNTPDISGVKSSFINRYYGKAHKVL